MLWSVPGTNQYWGYKAYCSWIQQEYLISLPVSTYYNSDVNTCCPGCPTCMLANTTFKQTRHLSSFTLKETWPCIWRFKFYFDTLMLLVCLWCSNSVLRWSVFWLMLFVCLWCSHSVLRWSVFWLMLLVSLWCSNSALRSSVFWLMLFVCLWCSNSVLRSSLFWLNSTLLWKMVIFLSIHVNCHEWLINFVHTLYYVEIVWFNFSRTFQGNNRFETSINNNTMIDLQLQNVLSLL